MRVKPGICSLIIVLSMITRLYADTTPYYQDSIEKSYKVKSGGALIVDSNLGDLDIQGKESGKVEIEVIRRVKTMNERKAKSILDDLEMDIQKEGNDVRIYCRYHRNKGVFFDMGNWKLNLKFVIKVPENYNLNLKTGDGDVQIHRIDGDIQCHTSDGDISTREIVGPLNLKTSDGDVFVNDVEGIADIKTSDGDIDVDHVTQEVRLYTSDGDINADNIGGSVTAKTSDGNIVIYSAEGFVNLKTSDGDIRAHGFTQSINASTSDGDIDIKIDHQLSSESRLSTSDGSIRVGLNKDIKLTIDANARDGRVKTDFPVTVSGYHSKRHLQTEINGGGPELYIRSSDSDIHLYQH